MNRIRNGSILAGILIWAAPGLSAQAVLEAGTFVVADSSETVFYLHTDGNGLPDHYRSNVFTPVCEGTKCYAIEVLLYWDLAGRFLKLDTLTGKGLTKLDHRPFKPGDYHKLQLLLSDPSSQLALYDSKELVSKQRRSDIDGLTGATLEEIRSAVVEGAVYSCHTLWHIAHGAVRDSMQSATRSINSAELFRKFVSLQDDEMNLFLVRSMSSGMILECFPEILSSVRQGKGYYGKQVFESLPGEILAYESKQRLVARLYPGLDYFSRIALLEKLDRNQLKSELGRVLSNELDEKNTYENQLIRKLLNE